MSSPGNLLPIVEFTTDAATGGRIKDPVNLVFLGALAARERVLPIIVDTLGLRHDKGVSDQYFSEPADPDVAHRQDFNQSNHFISGFWSRIHARLYQVFTGDPTYGRLVVAAIHRDRWVGCDPVVNDAAESYDAGRKYATSRLRTEYDVWVRHLRTFDPIEQCNLSRTGTDGLCAFVADRRAFIGDNGVLSGAGIHLLTEDEP